MTDAQLNDLIANDVKRWTRDGIAPDVIATRVASTRRYFRENESPFAQAAARLLSKIKGTAPGTPIDASPIVIESVASACSKCAGADWVQNEAGNLVVCDRCDAADRIAARRAASVDKYSSADGRAAFQTFDDFVIPAADKIGLAARLSLKACLAAARNFAANPSGWLIIHGPAGNGKSHLSAAVYNKLRTRKQPTIYSTAPAILKSIQELFDADTAKAEGVTSAQRISTYQTVPVLILDDLGADYATDWRAATWFEIMDARYRKELPTMLTMNMAPSDERLGFRLADRLCDTHDGFSVIQNNIAPTFRRA